MAIMDGSREPKPFLTSPRSQRNTISMEGESQGKGYHGAVSRIQSVLKGETIAAQMGSERNAWQPLSSSLCTSMKDA